MLFKIPYSSYRFAMDLLRSNANVDYQSTLIWQVITYKHDKYVAIVTMPSATSIALLEVPV